MKKTVLQIFACLFALILSVSCSDDNGSDLPGISTSKHTLEATPNEFKLLSASGSTVSIAVYSDVLWGVESSEDWITPDLTSSYANGFVKLTIAPNYNLFEREGTVRIKSKQQGFSKTIEITISQKGATDDPDNPDNPDNPNYYLNATPLEMLGLPHTGGSVDLAITSNVRWRIDDLPAWISTATLNGSNDAFVTLYVEANEKSLERSATFSVTSTTAAFSRSVKIRVTQSAPTTGGETVITFEIIGFNDENWDDSGSNSDFDKTGFPENNWD